jgi:hypothetical protein
MWSELKPNKNKKKSYGTNKTPLDKDSPVLNGTYSDTFYLNVIRHIICEINVSFGNLPQKKTFGFIWTLSLCIVT